MTSDLLRASIWPRIFLNILLWQLCLWRLPACKAVSTCYRPYFVTTDFRMSSYNSWKRLMYKRLVLVYPLSSCTFKADTERFDETIFITTLSLGSSFYDPLMFLASCRSFPLFPFHQNISCAYLVPGAQVVNPKRLSNKG